MRCARLDHVDALCLAELSRLNLSSLFLRPCLLSTGQVQSKKCIEEVLHFAYEENLFVMSDEVITISARLHLHFG